MTSIAERVDRGEKFLNEVFPTWKQSIDLDKLDLASPNRCVLGQLFGWTPGANALRAYAHVEPSTLEQEAYLAAEYGFERDPGAGEWYSDLQDEWVARLSS